MSLKDKLATVESLDAQVLTEIFQGDRIAVHVPNFFDAVASKSLSDSLHKEIDQDASGGIYESNIDSFWNVMNDDERRERYFGVALPLQRRLRDLSAPYPSPVDLLRVALDEAWPGGATLMAISGRKMPFGITRVWKTGSEALPHQDALWREVKDEDRVVPLQGQLGANIYLDTADEGGALETWDHVISDEEYAGLREEHPGSYGYPREMLPSESVQIEPQVGDLVLVNTMNVHAVRKITCGRRITVSGFVGNAGIEQPLRLWS